MSIKKVLVTGATGLVGKRLVGKLAKEGFELSVFVRATKDNAFFEENKARIFLGSVKDKGSIEQAVAGQDAVIHLIGTFQPEPGLTLDDVNAAATYNFHSAAHENKIQKFIFLSAYGASIGVKNAFLVSKGRAEVDIMQGEVPYVILRSTPIYGEGSFFSALMKALTEKGKVPLIGTGKQQLQPIYVGDVVEYLHQALVGPAATQRVLEIGGPDKVSYEELIRTVGELTGKKVTIARVPGFLRPFLTPIKINGGGVAPAKEILDFYSRDSFVSIERAKSVIPLELTPLRPGLQKSLN